MAEAACGGDADDDDDHEHFFATIFHRDNDETSLTTCVFMVANAPRKFSTGFFVSFTRENRINYDRTNGSELQAGAMIEL